MIVLFCHKQVGSVAKILEKGVNNGIGATVMAAAILGFSWRTSVLSGIPVHYQLCNGSEDEPVSDRVLRTEYPCRYPWKRNLFHRHVL